MQTGAIATRLTTAAHSNNIQLNLSSGQLVVDDWRLRGWTLTAAGGAWAAPTTVYSIVSTASGDYITKPVSGVNIGYNTHTLYNTLILYNGSGTAYWPYMYQDLGKNTPVNLPDGSTGSPYIDSIAISANEDLIVWYANQPIGLIDGGIWCERVYDDLSGHLQWSPPTLICANTVVDDTNGQSTSFMCFPRIQVINGEAWVLALECLKQNAIVTFNLCYFRSTDNGQTWTDKQYLAGTSTDASENNTGINSYLNVATPTAFTRDDLKNAYLSVSGNSTYLISNGGHGNFVCGSTTLVGVTNSAKQVDITADVEAWSLRMAAAPTAAEGRYTLQNPGQKYNSQVGVGSGSEVIVPGARLLHQAGYVDSSGSEVLTVATELIEAIPQATALAKNQFELTTQDYSAWLRDQELDRYLEYYSPKQASYDLICDLTGFNVIHGTFTTDSSGNLIAGNIDNSSNTVDNVALYLGSTRNDGFQYQRFRITTSLTKHWAGVTFQMDDTGFNFWVVIYNGNSKKFELKHANPTTQGQRLYRYVSTPQTSSVITLTAGTWYWLGWLQQGNHVTAWYTTDVAGAPATTWTKVIDYTSPLTPATSVLRAQHAAVGVVGKSTYNLNRQTGNVDASRGPYQLDDGAGNPLTVSLKFTAPSGVVKLKSILAVMGTSGSPPDLTLGVCYDNGGQPSDITNDSNVVFRKSSPALNYNAKDLPAWGGVPVPGVTLTGGATYHIFVTFNNTLAGAEGWWTWSQGVSAPYGSNMSYVSTDGGATWVSTLTKYGDATLALAAVIYTDQNNGLAEFSTLRWSSGEMPQTMEHISADLAAKASVVGTRFDSFVRDSDLVLGGDGILWQPTSFGTMGDFVLDTDVNISSAATVVFRSSAINGGTTNGWQVKVDPTTQKISFYTTGNTLLATLDSVQYLQTGVNQHLTVACWNSFLYVYVNECLAAGWYNANLTTAGYVGVVNAGATWTNLRIPDLTVILGEHVVESNKSMASALQELFGRTHAGGPNPSALRYRYFIDFAGKLRAGSFSRLVSVDTYQSSSGLMTAEWDLTNRYSIGVLIPSGDYYALHLNAQELDRTGRRNFRRQDYTDVFSNEEAYEAGAAVFRQMQELAQGYQLDSLASWAAEREDRITVTNPLDGHTSDFVIHSLDWNYARVDKPHPGQKLSLRKFVS